MRATTSVGPIAAHYFTAAPLIERSFGGTPLVWVTWPWGPGKAPFYHGELSATTKLREPAIDVVTSSGTHRYSRLCEELIHRLVAVGAVEFHGWGPMKDDPSRAAFARLLIELHDPAIPTTVLKEAAIALRALVFSEGLECIPVFDGISGVALWIPFADGPAYPDVRTWLNGVCEKAVAAHPDLVTLEPNTHASSAAHLHVSSNAPGRHSALPYSARGVSGNPLVLPIAWPMLGSFENGSVCVGGLDDWLKAHGDVFASEMATIHPQVFGDRALRQAQGDTFDNLSMTQGAAMGAKAASHGPIVAAAVTVLSDGVTRTADEILAEAIKRGLVGADMVKKYVYTSLIEYIARANGNGRKPRIVQTEDRSFRLNEPEDRWPAVEMPADPPVSAATQALIDRLGSTAVGSDPTAFEVAVCDAFDALGFVAQHMGGQKAPDGFADAALGTLGYRVMIECKSAQNGVPHPDVFEAAKFKDAYRATYCALVGAAFGDEIELARELVNHGVAAFTVDDVQTLLRIGSNAFEMKRMFAPGFAADALADVVWERAHGRAKRLRFIEETIVRAAWALQVAQAPANRPADAPVLDVDAAMWVVDQALAAAGATANCDRDDVVAALDALACRGVMESANGVVIDPPNHGL